MSAADVGDPGAALQALDDAVKRRQTDDLRPEAVRFLHVADVQHQMIVAARGVTGLFMAFLQMFVPVLAFTARPA
jgi:hypothetical protein